MLKVVLPNGKVLEYDRRVRAVDVAADIGPRLARDAVAAQVDGHTVGVSSYLPTEGEVQLRLLTAKDPEALAMMRHSVPSDGPGRNAALRGRAIGLRSHGRQRLLLRFRVETPAFGRRLAASRPKWPGSSATTSPSSASKSRRPGIQFARTWARRSRSSTSTGGLADQETVSFYRQGEFIDLCRGPHVPRAGAIGAFKLLSVAGAYWKGDATRQQLQRLYATAWFSKQELDDISSSSRRPSAATTACWAGNWNCSPSIRWWAPA